MANGILMPTTSAQVSGHRFLVRRIEHGLVLGDVRMIHDPLSRRRRAVIFGVVACVLMGVASVAMALFRPMIDPGDAPIIRAESGALFVRVDDAVHPVANLASARLVAGEAAEPVAASDAVIMDTPRGVPIGLVDAPAIISPGGPSEFGDAWWLGCQDNTSGDMHVAVLGAQPPRLGTGEGVVGASQSATGEVTWHLITDRGRAALPGADTHEGRVVRRHLAITADTPVWHLAPEMLNLIPEQPGVVFPDPLPEVVQAGARSWMRVGDALQAITPLQHGMLIDAGAHTVHEIRPAIGGYPETDTLTLTLPDTLLEWVDTTGMVVCADGEGPVMVLDGLEPGVALSGESAAVEFHSGLGGAVGVDSRFGYYLVGDTGLVHAVADGETMSALGVSEVYEVPWLVLGLLPGGSDLSQTAALQPMY